VPRCDCGGIIKPDVVLYEEALDAAVMTASVQQLAAADTLIVGGTSLVVYPAAGLVQAFQGDYLVLINKQATPMDHLATLVVHEPIGEALGAAVG
jgi:NAD-dependent deacetylase